jgi:PPM family protein phosphatase
MKIQIYAHTNIGKVRRHNEDGFLILNLADHEFHMSTGEADKSAGLSSEEADKGILLMVTDGTGGFSGIAASRTAIEIVVEHLKSAVSEDADLLREFHSAIVEADMKIYEKSHGDDLKLIGMCATFTGALITGDKLFTLNLGENRVYLIRRNQIHQLTKDQSYLNFLLDNGLTLEDLKNAIFRMEVMYILGVDVKYSLAALANFVRLEEDDLILVCSDGLVDDSITAPYSEFDPNRVNNEEKLSIILENANDPVEIGRLLIEKANSKEVPDNITVIVARLTDEKLGKPGAKPVPQKVWLDRREYAEYLKDL